ncbi:hypothetical protein COT30_03030 [Candidatus Micrarchaeota archaeon CG08_land_8_20_14_0_20_49_17]|nr:MAG: hypothetical protein AUJ13_03225 [Candidatus Micrarchaeota archaeon CG1_02_49_24]PIU09709.1 MAG: hypothetical protein COT30_03030 [Candidatus Micrarchaeota archaeon CG08_land_8_20_14_0_20_49_17]PIU82146.1 MAG: hypothetical protein COS70_02080 [Candidatus Micrarchaeota archaeon CG06_land_8_20_14_3_00_50_6]PIZ93141.1 MAG: hypothetical protein COX84_06135 [Candidatus Micrarchaeota archaeon CG_4_10_14_0_2_um_filter_49_7]HII54221.1 ABC transporter substrate-binding protein [Candidatus Micrar
MKFEISRAIIFAACVLGLLAIAFIANALMQKGPAAASATIHVAYLPVTQSLPLFVAIENGMFEREGLNVEAVRIESPNQIIDALLAGQAEAGAPSTASGITAIADLKKPGFLKIYAFNCGTPEILNDELLVAKNSGIQSINDLEGKRLGIIPGIQFSTVAKKILMETGVDPSSVALIELPVPNQLPALSSGSVDALLTLEPTGTIGGQKNISRILVGGPMVKYVSNPWCGGAGIVTGKFLQENPDAARKFLKVMRQAIADTNNNPENMQYLVKYLNLPESVVKNAPLPLLVTADNLDPGIEASYQKFVDVFFELGVVNQRPEVKHLLINDTFWE